MPFFSIIIPTYNRVNLIGATIQSVIDQTFIDFELLIVDDGSTDNTKEVIDSYNDKRIQYIYQVNGERGKARNNGVIHAKGKYVFFLDSDDLLYPDHLKHAAEKIKELNEPVFFHIRYEEIINKQKKAAETLYLSSIRKTIEKQNKFACQFFLKRDIALAFPFSENRDLKIGEDWEVILKIAVRYPINFSNEVHAAIVHHGERSMEVASAETILKSKIILLENLKKDSKISKRILQNVNAELTSLAALAASIAKKKKEAFKLLRKAVCMRKNMFFKRRTLAILKKIIIGG